MFRVVIDFKGKGPAFSTNLDAANEKSAEVRALSFARQSGFDQPVKKIKAIQMQTEFQQ